MLAANRMEKPAAAALASAGAQLFREIGRDDPFAYPPPAALQFIQERQNKLGGVPDEIFSAIKTTLEDGLNAGDTMAQLSDRVRAAFNGADRERATRIAMTETGAAYGASRQEAMRQAGVKYKRWLTSGNANVRSAHAAANGQTVRADENFIVDGEELAFPSDTRSTHSPPATRYRCLLTNQSSRGLMNSSAYRPGSVRTRFTSRIRSFSATVR